MYIKARLEQIDLLSDILKLAEEKHATLKARGTNQTAASSEDQLDKLDQLIEHSKVQHAKFKHWGADELSNVQLDICAALLNIRVLMGRATPSDKLARGFLHLALALKKMKSLLIAYETKQRNALESKQAG